MSKELTLIETYMALQSLQKATRNILTEHLRVSYSSEWEKKKLLTARKQVERDLKILIKMGLVELNDKEKEYTYSIKRNKAFISSAAKDINSIHTLLKDDKEILKKIQKPLSKIMAELESPFFVKSNTENITNTEIVSKLENAINNNLLINLQYKKDNIIKYKDIKPLKIARFDGLFYLLCESNKYIKLRISKIFECEVSNKNYQLKKIDELKIQQWHNVWHEPNKTPNRVKLWISNEIVEYFFDKNIFNINENKHKVHNCKDGIEYYIEVTHPLELFPQFMSWLPKITILEDIGELDLLGELKERLTKATALL